MKRINFFFFILIACVSGAFAGARTDVSSGNEFFEQGKYDKALDKYRQAEIAEPQNPVINFNKGDVGYKMNDYENAMLEYNKALSFRNRINKSKTYYNMGNTYYRQNKTQEALDSYKKSLILDPNNEDAKYNYEYLLMAKNTGKDKKDKDKKDKDNKDKKQQKKDEDSGKEDQKNKSSQEKKQGMSKEDAERIMRVFGEQEKNNAKNRKMQNPQLPKVDEDW